METGDRIRPYKKSSIGSQLNDIYGLKSPL